MTKLAATPMPALRISLLEYMAQTKYLIKRSRTIAPVATMPPMQASLSEFFSTSLRVLLRAKPTAAMTNPETSIPAPIEVAAASSAVVVAPMWAEIGGTSIPPHDNMNEVSCLYDRTILT